MYVGEGMQSVCFAIFRKKADGEPDKDTIAKEAVAAARVWEAKYTATEDSRQTYR